MDEAEEKRIWLAGYNAGRQQTYGWLTPEDAYRAWRIDPQAELPSYELTKALREALTLAAFPCLWYRNGMAASGAVPTACTGSSPAPGCGRLRYSSAA